MGGKSDSMSGRERILVIKFSALGDIVQAFAAFEQIRRAHMDADITLLTTPPYAELVRESGLFDRIETDGRPADNLGLLAMARRLRKAGYKRVYDMQTSGRSSRYRLLFFPDFPEWSGIAPGASHRQIRADRETMHNLDRMADQLHVAGIGPAYETGQAPSPNLIWALRRARGEDKTVAARFGIKPPFALLIPGASAGRPAKFWPIGEYRALARTLAARGMTVVAAGSAAEAPLGEAIVEAAPGAIDLTGRTRMIDLAALGAECALCVTNDTGPGHMAAYAGAPGLMLMSKVSSPRHYAPRAKMRTLQVDDLAQLPAAQVARELGELMPRAV
jgi:ADP-heptose:LPS heptosyltransferase